MTCKVAGMPPDGGEMESQDTFAEEVKANPGIEAESVMDWLAVAAPPAVAEKVKAVGDIW